VALRPSAESAARLMRQNRVVARSQGWAPAERVVLRAAGRAPRALSIDPARMRPSRLALADREVTDRHCGHLAASSRRVGGHVAVSVAVGAVSGRHLAEPMLVHGRHNGLSQGAGRFDERELEPGLHRA